MNVFKYTDHRLFLKDYYEEMKKRKPYFSYRHFSELAGVKASNFLYVIIKGERNLSKESIAKVSRGVGLIRQEHEYFENMVFYNQAKTLEDKNQFYSNMLQSKKEVPLKRVNKDQMEFYMDWYNCVIRELITMKDFHDDFQKLGESLNPPISANEAKQAVDLLINLNFIEKTENSTYTRCDPSIFICDKAANAIVLEKFHKMMLVKAMESVENVPRKDRLMASTTFSISRKTFDFFIKRTREFRRELQEIARLEERPEQVFQYVFNLFPLSDNIYD